MKQVKFTARKDLAIELMSQLMPILINVAELAVIVSVVYFLTNH